jgi:hypothetical protein
MERIDARLELLRNATWMVVNVYVSQIKVTRSGIFIQV